MQRLIRSATPPATSMSCVVVTVLIALPWLNPFAPGPTPAVVPWLFTLSCTALALLWTPRVPLAEVAARAWLGAALLSSVLGLLQYLGASAALTPWVNSTALGEAYANLRQRNQFATLTNIGLAALLWWCASGALLQQRHRTALWPVAAALLALGNAASSSRTGLAQLLLLLAMAWAWNRQRAAQRPSALPAVLLAAALAYALGSVALPLLAGLDPQASGMLARLQGGDARCSSRLTLWSNVLHLIAQKPWLGWGWSELAYAHFITLYPGERFCDILDNAHNLPLHLAVEFGLPMALLLCGGALWLTWRARPWRETDPSRQLAWSVLALILLHSLLEYPLWYGPFQVAFGLSVWLLWRSRAAGADWVPALGLTVRPLMSLLACLMLVVASYAAWDYDRVSQIYQTPARRAEAFRDNTLRKIGDSWLFRDQVRFAELATTELTTRNAAHIYALAKNLLHFSPEARVLQALIGSAERLGLADEARFYRLRYQAAFPESYARWDANGTL